MGSISSEEIISILKSEIENYDMVSKDQEVGKVIWVGDGIATVYGIEHAMYGEIVIFENGIRGMVQDIRRDQVGCIILGKDTEIKEGTKVTRTKKKAGVPVGDAYIGRIINALGAPIDGKGEIPADDYRAIEQEAPGIVDRQSVNQPMETGILAIDSMFPIGRGQRELIIGDRQTGKTSIAVDTILNQKGKDVICIYVAIGQKASTVAKLVNTLTKNGAMDYSIVLSSTASESASLQYIAPYAGTALAEYFMYKGKDVLIIYDDLSKHAVAYRALSLLLERSPGREAYPGDVFYLHSRLLERSSKLRRKQIEEYFAKTEALFKKNGMPAKLCVETQYKYKVHFDGKDYSISCQQGIHTKASAYEYINGVVPQNKNEIAITPTVSKLTGAKLGDTVTIDFGKETLDCVVVAYFQSMNQLGEVIRLHEDAPTDFTYIANVMSYQIDFDDHPSAKEIEVRKEKIKKLFDNEKVMNATEYCDDCMGAASTMESVQYLLLGITLIVVILVCILMERSFLADEKSQIAVLKAMGFSNKRVMEWHMIRFGIVTLVAVILAAICSIPATYLIDHPIFGMMGAGKVAYVIRPWKIFFLYPGIIFLMTLLASGMTALQIRTIKSNDTTNIE